MRLPVILALLVLAAPLTARGDLHREAATARARSDAAAARAGAANRAADRALAEVSRAADRVAAADMAIARADAHLAGLRRAQARRRARVAAQRAPLAALAAGLATMARRPPALALVSPGSIADLVHVRIALDAAIPAVAARTAALRGEMAAADRQSTRIAALSADLVAARRQRDSDRARLAALAEVGRSHAERLAGAALSASDAAIALADRIRQAEDSRRIAQADRDTGRRLAALAVPALPDPARALSPSGWRLPVTGRLIEGFGETGADGVPSRGLTLALQPGVTVRAPAAGRVAFAGPFAGRGDIVILTHANGFTTLVAGLDRLAVSAGQTLAAGTALGHADAQVTVELRRAGTPVDAALYAARR